MEWLFWILTYWGQSRHIWVSKLTIIGSGNGLLPALCQSIIWTSAGLLSIGTLGTNLSENLSKIHIFSFKKMHLKMYVCEMAAILSRPQCIKEKMTMLERHSTAQGSVIWLRKEHSPQWNGNSALRDFMRLNTESFHHITPSTASDKHAKY